MKFGMGIERVALEPDTQGLPVNGCAYPGGHEGVTQQLPHKVGCSGALAFQLQGGLEHLLTRLAVGQVQYQVLTGAVAAPVIFHVHGVEGRHVHGLWKGYFQPVVLPAHRENVAVSLVPGRIGYLGHQIFQRFAVLREAVVAGDRVHNEPEVPEVGQQSNRPARPLPGHLLYPVVDRLFQGHGRVAEKILAAKAGDRRPAGGPPWHSVEQTGQLIEIKVGHKHPVAESVVVGTEAPVRHPAGVQCALHAALPCTCSGARDFSGISLSMPCATRSALCTPSSWNPLRQ